MSDFMHFGENCTHDMNSRLTGLNNNVLVVGATGSGKTKSIVEPQLLYTNDTSLVVVISKRALYERYAPMFERRGYDVLDLNLAHPEDSTTGYDPLQYIHSPKDCITLGRAIVFAGTGGEHFRADPYWDESACSLLTAFIALAYQGRDRNPSYATWKEGEAPTFNDVLKLYAKMKPKSVSDGVVNTNLDQYFDEAEFHERGNLATSCWKTVKDLSYRTYSCIVSCANVTVDKVFNAEVRQLIAQPNKVDFTQLAKKKTVLFVTVSPTDLGQQTFLNILYNDLFRELFTFAERCPNSTLPIPVHVIMDDFAGAGIISDYPLKISIMRALGISVSMLVQSESQLATMYGEGNATTIINNTDSYVYLGGMDLKSCTNISHRLNVPLDEVLYMPLDKVIVFQRGKRPVVTKRYKIMEDELYKATEADYIAAQQEKLNKANEEREDYENE